MRLIGLAVVLALSLAAPLAAEAQPAARVFRIGVLGPAPVVPTPSVFKQVEGGGVRGFWVSTERQGAYPISKRSSSVKLPSRTTMTSSENITPAG